MCYATHIPQMDEKTWLNHARYVQATMNRFYEVNIPSVRDDVVNYYEKHGLSERDSLGIINIMVCMDGFYEHVK